MKPASLVWAAVVVLLAFVGLNGCRALPPAPPPTAVASAEELLARLQNRDRSSESFQARGRITFLSPERNYSGTILVKARRPESLRVDILDILGRTLLSLAANGDQVQVLSPSEGKFFHGPASPRNLAAFIPPAVTLPQALRLLVGALPLSPGPPSKFDYDPAAGQYLLEWRQAEGHPGAPVGGGPGPLPAEGRILRRRRAPRFTASWPISGRRSRTSPARSPSRPRPPSWNCGWPIRN